QSHSTRFNYTTLFRSIDKRHDILKTRIASYQEHGGDVSYLEVIFNAKDFSEFISRVSSVSAITNADKELMEQQEEDREAVEEKRSEEIRLNYSDGSIS